MATYTARNEYGDGRIEFVEYEIAEDTEPTVEDKAEAYDILMGEGAAE